MKIRIWVENVTFKTFGLECRNGGLGQRGKHCKCWDVDTPYLMDLPLRKHSLEHAAEKCLTHIGGMFLTRDVCKQQPSPSVVIRVQCERPHSRYRMGVVWKTRSSCWYIFGISKDLNLISWKTKGAILFVVNQNRRAICLPHFWAAFDTNDPKIIYMNCWSSCPTYLYKYCLYNFLFRVSQRRREAQRKCICGATLRVEITLMILDETIWYKMLNVWRLLQSSSAAAIKRIFKLLASNWLIAFNSYD